MNLPTHFTVHYGSDHSNVTFLTQNLPPRLFSGSATEMRIEGALMDTSAGQRSLFSATALGQFYKVTHEARPQKTPGATDQGRNIKQFALLCGPHTSKNTIIPTIQGEKQMRIYPKPRWVENKPRCLQT